MTHLSPSFFTLPADSLLVAALCASAGMAWDVRTRRIPNFLTATFFLFGLLLHMATGGWKSCAFALAAGLVAGGVFLLFFIAGGMGAGDVKLMAAVCCIAGFGHLLEILIATALAGGVFALGLAIVRGRLRSTLANVCKLIGHHAAMGWMPHPELNVNQPATLRLPYGIAIAAGCWITFFAPARLG